MNCKLINLESFRSKNVIMKLQSCDFPCLFQLHWPFNAVLPEVSLPNMKRLLRVDVWIVKHFLLAFFILCTHTKSCLIGHPVFSVRCVDFDISAKDVGNNGWYLFVAGVRIVPR